MNAEIPENVAVMSAAERAVVRSVLRFPGFEVDIDRGELRVDGRVVPLRPKTFALLTYLATHPGRLLTRDALIQAVWRDVIVTDDSLVQCISELRVALGDQRQKMIRTVPRRGYILELAPVASTAPVETGTSEPHPAPPPSLTPSPAFTPGRYQAGMVCIGASKRLNSVRRWRRLGLGAHAGNDSAASDTSYRGDSSNNRCAAVCKFRLDVSQPLLRRRHPRLT